MTTLTKRIFSGLAVVTAIVAASLLVSAARSSPETAAPQQQEKPNQQTAFDKTAYSLDDATSPWVIVNKQRPLRPASFVPTDLVLPNVAQRVTGTEQMKLRLEAAKSLERMFADAQKSDLKLQITTAFRGYNYQKSLYNGYVKKQGQQVADTQSARPGYSEHQTGWAVDIRPLSGKCYLEACFGELPEGKWLAENSWKYGFIIRYAEDKTASTGYTYEPWHFRYVGNSLAAELHRNSMPTLEEFFNLSPAATY